MFLIVTQQNLRQIAEARYAEGETALLDVLTIQQSVFDTESNLIAIKPAQLEQYIAVNLALGGNWEGL